MAAANDVYTTSFELNGKVSPDLLKGIEAIYKDLGKIVSQNKEVAKETKKAFEGFQKFLGETTKKTRELAISLKDLMLPLLGISLAYKGFTTLGDTIQAAIDKFKGAREAAASFQATLEAIMGMGRTGRLEAFLKAQQERLKGGGPAGFEGIYGAGLFRAVQEEMARAGVALGDRAIHGLIEAIAYKERTLKITSDQARDFARKVGIAVALPRGGRMDRETMEMLRTLGVQNLEKFSKMTGAERIAAMISGFKKLHYIEDLVKANKEQAELMRAQTEESGLLVQIGALWEKLQIKGDLVSEHLKNAFLEAFIPASAAIQKILEGPMNELDKRVSILKVAFREIFNPSEDDVKKGFKKLDSPEALFGNLTKAWKETILPQLTHDWDWFIGQVKEKWDALGKSDNPFLKGFHDNVDILIKAVGDLANAAGKIAGLSWDSLQNAALEVGKAAKDLDEVLTNWKALFPARGTPAEIAKARAEAEAAGAMPKSGPVPTHPGLHGLGYQFGGIISTPQVGLVGEAGPESIVPLKQDANTLNILGQTLSQLQVNPMDPNAYGHELFDTMRTVGAGFGLGAGYGGAPGFTGNVGGVFYTEYGPSIDPPGSPDYDYNSYHRIGAWPGITGPLEPGDVALGYGAQSFYGVRPGQTFVDTRGNTVRFADRSGSKNPMNEDIFRLAGGGIVSRKILSWLGEKGPEAVVPLSGNRGRDALQGALGAAGHTFHFSPTINVSGVATDEVVDNLIAELRNNFSRWLDDAAFEHERRAFS